MIIADNKKKFTITLISLFLLAWTRPSFALTAGQEYTITIDRLSSSGTITSLGLTTTATAGADGKVSFSLTGVPDNSSCNFLVVTIKDNTGAVVRKSIAPCPDPGGTLPVGVSGLTQKQTDALLAATAAAGTDDPILAVFGFAIVRSTGLSASDISAMADFANHGINDPGGFLDYLRSNGVTSAGLSAYRTSIVSRLADPNGGYSKLFKDSVDAADTTAEANKRGEAAALLLNILVKAATTAGFAQDRVLEAFDAMGAKVVPLMQTAVANGTLSSSGSQMVNSSIGGGITKLRAERTVEKYTNALSTLGATGGDLTTYQTAATNLTNSMISAFRQFEQVFNGSETGAQIQAAQAALDASMQTAFTTFMTAVAVSNARLNTMISNIETALGIPQGTSGLTASNFQFYTSGGTTVNWPVTMVIPTDWVSSVLIAGGSLSYTRDTTSIPANMTWLGSCSNNIYYDKTTCQANGGTWTAARTNFVGQGLPSAYAAILGLQQDVMVIEATRWQSEGSAGSDMALQQALEKTFSDKMTALAGNLSGTTNGSTAIISTKKAALVTLMQSPQF